MGRQQLPMIRQCRRKNRAIETMVLVRQRRGVARSGAWSSNREGHSKCALGPLPVSLVVMRRPGPRGYSPDGWLRQAV